MRDMGIGGEWWGAGWDLSQWKASLGNTKIRSLWIVFHTSCDAHLSRIAQTSADWANNQERLPEIK